MVAKSCSRVLCAKLGAEQVVVVYCARENIRK